jgi:N-acetylglucosaminyldiphosphoundecaprenol N-acetyl-beta-D-mannosaminyltransferase
LNATTRSGAAVERVPDDGLTRVRLFDLEFVSATMDELVTEIVRHRPSPDWMPIVVTPNVDELALREREADVVVRRVYASAQYVIPDGMPIVLASRLAGHPLRGRLAGSDLFARLWPRTAGSIPVLAVAPSEDVRGLLAQGHRDATIVVAPRFATSAPMILERFVDQVIEQTLAHPPRFAFVGLGSPWGYKVIDAILARWPVAAGPPPLCFALGASLEMYTGVTPRAPRLMQRVGLEWFYRFLREPRRLFSRYFVRDAAFLPAMAREVYAARFRRQP